jgi:PAS domain-containing protein
MDRVNSAPLFEKLDSRWGLWLVALLVVVVAVLDYATGYQIRLSILYLFPIALGTWIAGFATGVSVAIAAILFWLLSFSAEHLYPHPAFYFWEAAVELFGFIALAWVVARLRRALMQADERFFRLLEGMQSAVMVCDERNGRLLYANPAMLRISGDGNFPGPEELKRRFGEDVSADAKVMPTGDGFTSITIRDPVSGAWYLLQTGSIPWGENPSVTVNVLTDISAQKQAEAFREKHIDAINQSSRQAALA